MRNVYSVKTIIRKDKPREDGTYPLNYLVIVNSKRIKFSAGRYLALSNWDSVKGLPRGKSYATLRKKLEQEVRKLEEILLEIDLSGKPMTRELIREMYLGTADDRNTRNFYHHFDEFCKKKFLEISKGTSNHYSLLKKQLEEYKPNLVLEEMDYNFFVNFFHYLRTEKGVGESGIGTRRKTLVCTFNEFKRIGLVKENPCQEIKRPKENERDEFLTEKEVQKIVDVDLSTQVYSDGFKLTRNLFLFSCFTGLRFSDVMNLRRENIVENCSKIVIVMQKTQRKIEIPINREAKLLLMRYKYMTTKKEFVFPRRTNVSVNRDLKIIAKIAGISKRITFHMARHSFGSMLAKKGVQPYFIMKLMGHTNIKMTSRYVNSDEETLKEIMFNFNFKNYEKSRTNQRLGKETSNAKKN